MKKLIIISAPSGAGKTTLIKEILKENFNLEFSISTCSREKRKGEIDKKDYYFISLKKFKEKIKENAFIEWEEVYKNNFYGTSNDEINRIWENGKNIIFDIDVIGGLNIKKQFPKNSIAIFIMPPSIEELEKRLKKRSTDDKKNILKRIKKAKDEIKFSDKFDEIIVNDNLQEALIKLKKLIKKFLDFK